MAWEHGIAAHDALRVSRSLFAASSPARIGRSRKQKLISSLEGEALTSASRLPPRELLFALLPAGSLQVEQVR
jgi:hypothetical protein